MGPVILQKTVRIEPDDTLGSVYFDRLFPLGVAALLEAADEVVSGRHREVAQNELAASYEGWCRDAESEINWHCHVDQVYNLIRGCNPSPGAWTAVQGKKVRIFDARKHRVTRFGDVGGKPGEIVAIGGESVLIAAQGGRLEIFTVRAEGEPKTSAARFVQAAGLGIGKPFGGRHTPKP